MGYFIRKRKMGWSLVRTYYENGQCCAPIVPPADYAKYSFSELMTLEEAKEHAKRLNRESRKDNWAKKKEKILTRIKKEDLEEIEHLPPKLCEGFLKELEALPDPKSLESQWRAARRLIKNVRIPPCEWRRRSQAIYNYFERNHLSKSYAKKIVRVMNIWGEFYAAKTGQPYSHLKSPTGFAAGRIMQAYEKSRRQNKASDGLTPEALALARRSLEPIHFNWLVISLWFGLRPSEVENLKRGEEFAYFSHDPDKGVDLLNVRQTKLSNLPEDEQWKAIPILYPEQRQAANLIQSGHFQHPLPATIKRHTLGRHHRYAGRKGFGPLMWEKGHDVVEVSAWLGHKSIDRTYRDYMRWRKLKLRRIPPAAPPLKLTG